MPFKRPTLTELRDRNRVQLESELRKTGSLLRFSNMRILADADAGLSHLHYAYLDYIAQQSTPYTATDEWLSGWAAMKSVYQNAAEAAHTASYQFSGTPGAMVDKGVVLNRGDGYQYRLDTGITIGPGGTGVGALTAILPDIVSDASGGGISGNADAGTILTLDVALPGIESSGVMVGPAVGGADIEEQENFRPACCWPIKILPKAAAILTISNGRLLFQGYPLLGKAPADGSRDCWRIHNVRRQR